MGTITSGVGLISGINTGQLIDQLIAIDAQPQTLVKQNNAILTSQQVAFQDINARLLVLKLAADGFTTNKVFNTTAVASTNENVLTATSGNSAVPGTYNFTVSRLVSSQQTITRGFADTDASPVGAGTLTFEFGDAKLDSDTNLSRLNAGAGVSRGKIRITDRSGAAAIVDLSTALTVGDVIDAINNTSGINVSASVDGDHLQLTDNTGAVTTALSVANVGTNGTATSLGLTTASVGTTITGGTINTIGRNTQLAQLNDGNGVRFLGAQSDFRITDEAGTNYDINLDSVNTLGGVIDAINNFTGNTTVVAAVSSDGTGIKLTDSSGGGGTLAVTALNGSSAAADLGILTTDGDADHSIVGSRLIGTLNSRLLKNLNGGTGVSAGTLGTVRITNRLGVATDVSLAGAQSVADIIKTINAAGAGVTASVDSTGTGLKLTDTTGATASNLIVADQTGTAATDLKIAGSVAAASIDSGNLQFRYLSESTRLASLNGGQGVSQGKFKITDSSGATATVDLSQGNEVTIDDVLSEINSRGLAIHARINDHGDGILIEDTGPGTLGIKVEESGSTTARDLGLLGSGTAGTDYNASFEKTVTIGAADTLDDVITSINNTGLGVAATIINDGSGTSPFRLSLSAKKSGQAGAFVFDDGGLGFEAQDLVKAQNAAVFFGAADPARAVAITSASNTLNAVIPGATIDLHAVSSSPVSVSITKDNTAIQQAVSKFVDGFNDVLTTLDKYDTFNADTQQKGLLLGDSTVSQIRNSLFRLINNRDTDLSGQFNSLSQIGVTIGSGANLQFNQEKFSTALEADPDAVQALFTFKQTSTDSQGVITTTAAGIGVKIAALLKNLTDGQNGAIQLKLDALTKQIDLGNQRIADLQTLLDAKRAHLQAQFNAMETALASLQQQSSALAGIQPLTSPTTTKSTTK